MKLSVKPYWFVNDLDGKPMKCDLKNCDKFNFIKWRKCRKQIGNYFETKEEAEKALEKLKAWKRLKDKGFEFIGKTYETDKYFGSAFFKVDDGTYSEDIMHDLFLLFGGEE